MDPLSAGASVLAFGGILNSLQLIYSTLCAVRDGPENIRIVASQILRLCSVLDQLRNQSSSASLDPATQIHLKQDADVINQLAGKLAKMQIYASERRAGNIWKRIKASLGEKDLKKAQDVITNCTATLTLRLLVGQIETLTECKNEIFLLKDTINHQTSMTLQSHSTAITNTCASQSLSFTSGGKLSKQGQIDEMLRILRRLQAWTIPEPQTVMSRVVEVTAEDPNATEDTTSNMQDEFMQTIHDLCFVIGENERFIRYEQAEDIIKKLQKLVRCTSSYQKDAAARSCWNAPEASMSKDLERISALLGASEKLSLNKAAPKQPCNTEIVMAQDRWQRQFYVASGCLTFTTTRQRQRKHVSDTSILDDYKEGFEHFSASLTYFPSKKSPLRKMLGVFIEQLERPNGSFLAMPTIVANRVVPNNSLVFKLVARGALQDFRELLAQGKASVRDHDEDGQSLLFYSLTQPATCKFLIQSGLDVGYAVWGQHVCHPSREPFPRSPLYESHLVARYLHNEDVLQCRKLLLDAGSDPTLGDKAWFTISSPFRYALLQGVPSTIKTYLNHGNAFLASDASRLRPILRVLQGNATLADKKEIIPYLGLQCSSIHDRDNAGQSCLHVCLRYAKGPNSGLEDFDCLVFLIQQGADVNAVETSSGQSVSDLAYTPDGWQWYRRPSNVGGKRVAVGSYFGDLWNSVLAACGYSSLEFSRGVSQLPVYTEHYTLDHFKQLWIGRENQCPYWQEYVTAFESPTCEDHRIDSPGASTDLSAHGHMPDDDCTNSDVVEAPFTTTLPSMAGSISHEDFVLQQQLSLPSMSDLLSHNPWVD